MHTEFIERNGIASLASGIFGDAQKLAHQEIALIKAELREDLRNLKIATLGFASGIAVIFLGAVLVPFLLADLILYLSDNRIPPWGAYSIVCFVLTSIGLIVCASANKKFKSRTGSLKNISERIKEDFNV